MKKQLKFLLNLTILFFNIITYSQKEANFWYFGRNAALDFNSGVPLPVTGSQLNTTEGCSSFSDSDGNLLFYVGAPDSNSRSLTVWDKNNNPMPNGVGLQGDSSSAQSALTVPAPGRPNVYYLFTVGTLATGVGGGTAGFFLYEIDMNLNGGLGDINTTIGDSTGAINISDGKDNNWTEKVTAVRAEECDAYWVISLSEETSSNGSNEFYAYKVNAAGVDTANPVISQINTFRTDDVRGYLKVSPDGTKLVAANMSNGTFLFDFDDNTGIVTNYNNSSSLNQLNLNGNGYGVEFSTSSKRLYISTGNSSATQENLFQFNLNLPTIAEINNSRFNVHSYFNSRGALQLGPNGKIYWSSNNSNNISVINNPNELEAAVNYSHQSVNLGTGVTASQGLPPFISSLLLPIEISDSDNNQVINNQDLKFCIGDNKTLISETVTGSNITYEWFFNDGTTPIATTPNLTLNNLSKVDSGKYSLTINLTDDCGNVTQYNGTFNIEIFEAARAKGTPDPINFCDTDASSPNIFDLATLKNTEILDGLDPTIFDVLYFDTLDKANDNTVGTDLPNNYEVNTVSSQIIYARVHNSNAPNACFAITSFELEITSEPEPIQPTAYRLCDDIASGSDIDGITNNFDLSSKDLEILGTSLSPTQYTVSYHTSLVDAQTSSSTNPIDKNADYQVTNSQRIFVRVENIDNTNCNAVSNDTTGSSFMSFELIVDPLPVIKTPNPAQIRQCVNTADGRSTINLTIANINISDNINGSFEYYEDQTTTQQILNFTSYPVDANNNPPKSIWVKTISEFGCSRVSELELIIGTAADETYNETFTECDDFLDIDGNNTATNSDTDGITWFNLDKNAIIANINTNTNIDVFFYETTQDRDDSINEINISNYRNKNLPNINGNPFPIYYKLVNKINNDCTGIGEINLQVKSIPLANIPADINLCDDDLSGSTTDGENANINLRDHVDDILGTTQTEVDYIVSFHTTANGANTNTDVITNDTSFTNTAQNGFTLGDISEQTIFVRVQDRNGIQQCFNDHVSFKIIVNPVPTISSTVVDFAVCDVPTSSDSDTRNRIAQNIDLTSKDIEILDGKTNHRVAYYATQQDAENGNEITNPTDFQNITSQTVFPTNFNTDDPGIETIFFKVIDLGGNMCESVFATFQLLIYPEPNIPINISNYSDCDNISDSFADDDNGINGDISLKNKIPEILINYQPAEFADFSVTFYTSLADAESGNSSLAIDENIFENNNNNQTIFVRVENTKNTPIICVNTQLSFNINIISLPEFTVTGEDPNNPQILCLNYTTPHILEVENPAAGYDYEWEDKNGTVLGTNSTLTISEGGEYTVKATDITTTCNKSRTIYVEESEKATLLQEAVIIIDESNNIGSNDNISIFIDTVKNPLGKGDYQFAVRNDDNGDMFPAIGFQDEPLFENLEGGIYTIIVNDKNGCTPDEELQISVIQFPKFFTPNGDGKNDTWVIKGANKTFYPNSSINIFNRYGKLVAQLPIDSQGWDGNYNGKILPSDDYWFNVQLIPADITKPTINKKGHFSLLRK
ncbi:T9SS type B sorting domain-containing protein [Polaribacter sp. Hel1_85]|uniref:T9SS type B sorting domain-containing protein n=1 Tax=Polaribacter sp. Hel1_85 TaxID=1250005 RepID=UPI00052C6130|nr:T9SS type B sorting domain-containing protein [Polaribacter sp. Hel1_85]KGL63896.1 hypothetical protein PHEL85_0938 [Polaribacter sp. Hel1_85]